MGCARYIGRVGALAVALGVGVAVGNGPAIALADETGTTSSTGSSSEGGATGTGSTTGTGGTTSTTGTSSTAGTGSTTGTTGNAGSTTGTSTISGTVTTTGASSTAPGAGSITTGSTVVIGGGSSPQVTISSSGGATQTHTPSPPTNSPAPTVTAPESSQQAAEPTTQPSPQPAPKTKAGIAAVAPQANPPKPAAAIAPPSNPDPADIKPVGTVTQPLSATRNDPPTTAKTPTATSTFQGISPMAAQLTAPNPAPVAPPTSTAPTDPIGALVALPGQLISLATNLLSAAIAPFFGPNTDTPGDTPVLWGVYAWARRQFEQTFFNQTPTLAPTQTSLVVGEDGKIQGTLGPADPDGDPLTYWTTSDPEHGTVSLDQTNRTWTYTPDAGYKGTDSFAVKVSDAGPHIHLLSFLQPDFGNTATATVNVKVTDGTIGNAITLQGDPIGKPVYSTDGKYAYQLTQNAPDGYSFIAVRTGDGTVPQAAASSIGTIVGPGITATPDGQHAYFVISGVNNGTAYTSVHTLDLANTQTSPVSETVTHIEGQVLSADNVLLSADGTRIYLSTEADNPTLPGAKFTYVNVVDIASGARLPGGDQQGGHAITGLIESKDGSRLVQLVSTGVTTYALVTDSHTGQEVPFTAGLEPIPSVFGGTPVPQLTFSDDGNRAYYTVANAAQANTNTIGVVNLTNGLLATFDVATGSKVYFAGVHGDTLQAQSVVDSVGGPFADIKVFDATTGQQNGTGIALGTDDIRGIVFNSDGTGYWSYDYAGATRVAVINPSANGGVAYIDGHGGQLTLNNDGTKLYVLTGPDNASQKWLTVIDTATLATNSITLDDLARTPLIPTTDHTKAIVITQGTDANNNATLLARTIDLTNGQLIGTGVLLRDLVTPTGVTYSSDAGHAYLIGSTPGVVGETQLTVVDMATGELIGTPITTDGLAGRADGGPGTALEFGQGGTKALLFTRYLRSSDNMYSSVVTTVDLAQSQIIGTPVTISYDVSSVASDPTGTVFVVKPAGRSGPTIFDLNGHSLRPPIHNSGNAWWSSFSGDGKYLYFSDFKHIITKYAVTPTGFQEVGTVTLPDDFYLRSPLVLSPDGSRGIELGDNGVGGNNALRVIDLTGPAQSSPGSSAPSDPITGLLNLIGSVFVNQTPTLSPVVHRVDAANGVIVGNLGGHDAEGDKLVYTVTQQPLHGTVTIDQATGTWTYTATGPYGGDSFVIEASDGPGFHIHGIATLLTPGGGYTTTSTVNVFVPPI